MYQKSYWLGFFSIAVFMFSCRAFATTYSAIDYPFSWVDATAHSKLGPVTGGVYSTQYKFTNTGGCGTAPPTIDDTISDLIPLGFTFTYGTKSFTSVRVMSNGRLQFNNSTCGSGSPVTQLPYPNASLDYSMRIYGNDLDPTLKTEVAGYNTTCISRASCYISYASLGSAPDRKFVVTWNQVPEWSSGSTATGKYTMQIILKENSEFIFQFNDRAAGPNAATGQIGWQLTTTDYAVAGTGFPAKQLAYLFYIPNSGSMTPGAFNAFDSSTWIGSTTGVIQTKLAGTAFNLDVIALTSSTPPIVHTAFTGAVKVELVDAESSATCSAMTAIQTISSSYTFVAADKGRHAFTGITQANAYKNVKVRISYPASSPTKLACSTDAFAIRPSRFNTTASDSNWTTAGTARTLNASTATATPIHKSGQPITLTVSAYNSNNVVTSFYTGSPSVITNCVLPASSCVIGTFNTGSLSFSNGVGVSSNASFSEVGVISLTVEDAAFAQIDSSDGSSTSQRTISSGLVTVGRFVPDHFDLTLNTPQFSPSTGTFTYVGQPIKYLINPVVTLTAKNASNATVQNYSGSLWKITPGDAAYGIFPSYSEASRPLTVLNSSVPIVVDNGSGTGTLSFADTTNNILAVTRSNPLVPFNAEISLSFSLSDTDGVAVANVNGVARSNPVSFGTASTGNGIEFTGGNKTQRWGRLAMQNAFGSELTSLTLPLYAEYYNGTAFVPNTADNSTGLNLSTHLLLSNPATTGGLAQAGNAVMTIGPSGTSRAALAHSKLISGDAGLSFSAPGANNTGYVEVAGDFSSLPWLLFDWDHNGAHDNSPTAIVSFGFYRSNESLIYFREVY